MTVQDRAHSSEPPPLGLVGNGTAELPLRQRARVKVRALNLGERIDVRLLEEAAPLAVAPLMVAVGTRGCAVLFRYGVVVLFDVDSVEEAAFLEGLSRFVSEPVDAAQRQEEDATLRRSLGADEHAHHGVISLKSIDRERVQIVADVLAKSVVLAHYEQHVAGVFAKVEPLAAELSAGGASRRSSRELLRHIGNTLLISTKTVGRVEVTDTPEILWERPDHDLLYGRLEDEYELLERHQALERKLAVIERTASAALQLLQHHSNLRVEWYIVILIVAEILLLLFDMLVLR
jgi:uncharacterized Rmd1/YagE family protein